ncbi:MAG: hypothetical protein HY330_06705 [Chloroflexi bacterium]|nr:hypothetical protein [Chloroflexota bacterium]
MNPKNVDAELGYPGSIHSVILAAVRPEGTDYLELQGYLEGNRHRNPNALSLDEVLNKLESAGYIVKQKLPASTVIKRR